MSFGRKRFKRLISGKKSLQPFFTKLHRISLAGLNFGGGDNVGNSGERNVISYLRKHIGPGAVPVVFDVGANAGIYTREVLDVFGEKADIYCFEPLKGAFGILSGNMKGRANVKLYNFGFGEKEMSAVIHSNDPASPLASCFKRDAAHLGVDMKHSETIALKRLDGFCAEQSISHIDLLKVDVEGAELAVLKGAGRLIDTGAISIIQFEFGICDIDSRTFFKDFFVMLHPRYRIYRILKDGFEPVDAYTEAHEVFLTTNYMAVSRKELKGEAL